MFKTQLFLLKLGNRTNIEYIQSKAFGIEKTFNNGTIFVYQLHKQEMSFNFFDIFFRAFK